MSILNDLGIQIDVLLINIFLFLIFYFIFNKLVIKPYFSVFIEAQSKTLGDKSFYQKKQEENHFLREKINSSIVEINKEGKSLIDSYRLEGVKESKIIVDEVQKQMREYLDVTRKNISQEINSVKKELMIEKNIIGDMVIKKMLS